MVSGFYLVGALFFHWLMTVDFKKISFAAEPLHEPVSEERV